MDAEEDDEQGPDKKLEELYKSSRPTVELLPGVNLSAIINSTWLPKDAKTMLAESWIPVPAEGGEGGEGDAPAAPKASFDPSAIEYKELTKRVSKSAALSKWNLLTFRASELTAKIDEESQKKVKDEKELETWNAELETCKAGIAEADAQLAEMKQQLLEDPLSLTPWMQTLFDLLDAGLSNFEVGGPFFPYTSLQALFGADNTASVYEDSEKVLAAFKRRCDAERGPGKVQIFTRIVPNIFSPSYSPAVIEPLIDRVRATLFGAESAEPLDFVQLYWWDPKDCDVLPTLKALQKLSEDKLEINEETGEATVTEPKKIRGVGLVDFPARAIVSAIQAGVPVVAVQIPFSLSDRSFAETLAVCRQYNLKVLARDGLMGGVVSEKYLKIACPETTKPDADLDDVAHSLDLVNNYGGWEKVQKMLAAVKKVADKHGVKMQTVALRWQIDQGTFPVVTTRWGRQSWRQFGYDFWGGSTPGVDWQLFQVESFLDAADVKELNALAA